MRFIIDLLFVLLYCLALGGLGVLFFKRILRIEIDFFTGFFAGCGIAIMILLLLHFMLFYAYSYTQAPDFPKIYNQKR